MSIDTWGTNSDIEYLIKKGNAIEALSISVMRSVWSYFRQKGQLKYELANLKEIIRLPNAAVADHLQRLETQARHLSYFLGDLDPMEEDLIFSNLNTILCFALAFHLVEEPLHSFCLSSTISLISELPDSCTDFRAAGFYEMRSENLLEHLQRLKAS